MFDPNPRTKAGGRGFTLIELLVVIACRAPRRGVTARRAEVLLEPNVNSILANMEATRDGYDEALLLDTQGFVAEGAGENLFIVKDGQLVEPEMVSGLNGITRATVIELARDLGIACRRSR